MPETDDADEQGYYVSSTAGPIPHTVSESALTPLFFNERDVKFMVARLDQEGQSQVRDSPA